MKIEKGALLQDRYQIESLIGEGGMSYVYKAKDSKLGRIVALKVLKEEYAEKEDFVSKFQNEARAAAKLNHPNIVSTFDTVDEGKLHFIVMELVEGITLKEFIHRKSSLNEREAIGIALQLIDGIDTAHKMGIVHRDIKPQNIIVSTEGVVKIADFGIAGAAIQESGNASVMGSVHYISPEQARSGVSDERSDIYSFSCTLYGGSDSASARQCKGCIQSLGLYRMERNAEKGLSSIPEHCRYGRGFTTCLGGSGWKLYFRTGRRGEKEQPWQNANGPGNQYFI